MVFNPFPLQSLNYCDLVDLLFIDLLWFISKPFEVDKSIRSACYILFQNKMTLYDTFMFVETEMFYFIY